MPLLEVEDLHVSAGSTPLVKGVSFALEKGETLALVGESGSGKTLTSLAVIGLLGQGLEARARRMEFNSEELQTLRPRARRALRGSAISMVFQEPATAMNPVLTCGYQVEEAFIIHSTLNRGERRRRVLELFEKVKLPDPERIYDSYPHEISGGQRQRVMIAMALAHKPQLLIADEPTTALDVTVQAEILQLVKDLQAEMGMAMLWISHDFGVVKALSDRVMVMKDGKLVEEGATQTVFAKPKAAYTKQLLAAMPVLGTPPKRKAGGKVLLEAKGLNHTYRKPVGWWGKAQTLHALKDVSFALAEGRTLGVVGESGSGKSTLAKVLTRLIGADGGKVVFLGQEMTAADQAGLRTLRRDMQMVFQDPAAALNPKMKVGESIAEGIYAHATMPPAKVKPFVAKLLKDCGLPADAAGRYPHQFSGGQKQRICIARALALEPKLVICDEAVSALDVSVQAQILQLLEGIQQARGTSFVFISHDLRVVSTLADEVLVMQHGNVVEAGPTANIFQKPKHPYTKRLLAAVLA
ncbi:MAG: ABC transporter ATP-binding protein [Pseudomonadaceae bacterium]|nr:ABC transporter ATP-binding protein [Pseudomonadaceae bacterium]